MKRAKGKIGPRVGAMLIVSAVLVAIFGIWSTVKADFTFSFDTQLIAYWSFDTPGLDPVPDDAVSDTINDDGDLEDGAVYQGGADLPPVCDNIDALDVTSSSHSRLEVDNSTELNPEDSITVAAWIKPAVFPQNDFARIVFKGNDDSPFYVQYLLVFDQFGQRARFVIGSGGEPVVFSAVGTSPLSDTSRWYHVAGTYDSATGEAKIYVDGVLEDIDSGAIGQTINSPQAGADQIGIGRAANINAHPEWSFNGLIDDVRIYDVALTDDDIEELASPPTGGDDTDGDGVPDNCNQPPVANCQDVELMTALGVCTASPNPQELAAQVNAGSSDPNDDPIVLSITPSGPYNLGDNTVSLTAEDDKGETDFCKATIAVVDQEEPVLSCPDYVTTECAGPSGTAASFNATASDNCSLNPPVSCDHASGSIFSMGTTSTSCSATDASGNFSSCNVDVTVQDTTLPMISSVSANPNALWPPNHKMVPVTVSVTVSDTCDLKPACRITEVASNEPVTGKGDGNTAPDWNITGDLSVNLRAERSGKGSGRIYTITAACTDDSGNTAMETVTVTVPHDQRNGETPQKKVKK